jgi:hypothetical protein
METNEVIYESKHCHDRHYHSNAGDAVYGFGVIGAAIFFIGQATSFGVGVLGFLKAIVWPVFLVLEAFKALM